MIELVYNYSIWLKGHTFLLERGMWRQSKGIMTGIDTETMKGLLANDTAKYI